MHVTLPPAGESWFGRYSKAARQFILCAITALSCTHVASAQSDVYLKVYTKTFQRMEIDLYPFRGISQNTESAAVSDLILQVLENDLWMSGYFHVNRKTGIPASGGISKKDGGAEIQGSLARIEGTFEMEENSVNIIPHVTDRISARTIIKADYSDQPGRERYIIHGIADDIVYNLTGERGIARSGVAFVRELKDGSKEIVTMDYDGRNHVPVTSNHSINLSPAWSPDGTKLCYTSYKDENQHLYVFNFRTQTETKISGAKGLNSAAAWSPDGAQIALTLSKDGNAEIYTLNVDKKKMTRLTYNGAIDSSPTWSPSNRELAFTSDRGGSPQIYIMDSDGLNVRRLTFEGSYNDSPNWSPRGDKIVYVSRTASGFDIYTIDVTGENKMRLTDSSGSNEDPSWSPNGFALIFSSTREGDKALYSMFWDGSDQKKITQGGVSYLPAWSPLMN